MTDDYLPSVASSSHFFTRLSWLASHESVSADEIALPMMVIFGRLSSLHRTKRERTLLDISLKTSDVVALSVFAKCGARGKLRDLSRLPSWGKSEDGMIYFVL